MMQGDFLQSKTLKKWTGSYCRNQLYYIVTESSLTTEET